MPPDVRRGTHPARPAATGVRPTTPAGAPVNGHEQRLRSRRRGRGHAGAHWLSLVRGPAGSRRMIIITEHAEGYILPVRAQPGARKSVVLGEQAGALKVAVTAPPEDGRANKALVEALREALGVKRSQVELLSGPTSREKRFLIRGVRRSELEGKVAALVAG